MPIPIAVEAVASNRFLAALPENEFLKIKGSLEHVGFEAGDTLWESGEKAKHLYFPTTSLISLLYESEAGTSISIATIGRSGIVGTNLVLGDARTPDKAVVQYSGSAFRMDVDSVEEELANCGDFQSLLMAYTQVLIIKISQNAICNRLHRIEQQLARWILDCADDLETTELAMTHDQIASVLGVRRESVSLAMSQLQNRKIINGGRGKIAMCDAAGLKAASCECYSLVKQQLETSLKKYVRRRPN